MTNEELKLEAIKKAYGDKWDNVKDHIRVYDGSVATFPFLMEEGHEDDGFYYKELGYNHTDINPYIGGDMEPSRWRVKALDDIEDNNGWVCIEPDGSNLPESGDYYMYNSRNEKDDGRNMYTFHKERAVDFSKWFTHYKLIEKPLLPVY